MARSRRTATGHSRNKTEKQHLSQNGREVALKCLARKMNKAVVPSATNQTTKPNQAAPTNEQLVHTLHRPALCSIRLCRYVQD